MTGYDFDKAFTSQKDMPYYVAIDATLSARYGKKVRALFLSNAEYKRRFGRFGKENNMKPPPSCGRIFGGYVVVRNLGTRMQYETWMPDHGFEDTYQPAQPPRLKVAKQVAATQ